MRDYQREVFSVLLLDSRNHLLGYHELFHGTIDVTSVHPREVVKLALQNNAAAVIVAHNHPSGVSEPSNADIAITHRLKAALGLMDIRLLDHFIVGRGDITSLANQGKM
jgi:DNA repair protein RadC|tara:strand:+ start:147 stop:473 length:327 start_codon:yes stop_codon:yes gene_type:complete